MKASIAFCSTASVVGSSSARCKTETSNSNTACTGQISQTKKRTNGTNGSIQFPGRLATKTDGTNCIITMTSAARKHVISAAASQLPGTKKITPRAVSAATKTSQKRANNVAESAIFRRSA